MPPPRRTWPPGAASSGCCVDGAEVVGRISLTDIVRGAFQNGHLGYWIAQDQQGRGPGHRCHPLRLRRRAAELGLHRIQAATLRHNIASQTVLARNGFSTIGTAENYLRINGSWQDHVLFQRILTLKQVGIYGRR